MVKKVQKEVATKEVLPVLITVVDVVDKSAEKKAALAFMVNAFKMQIDSGHRLRTEQLDELLALANS